MQRGKFRRRFPKGWKSTQLLQVIRKVHRLDAVFSSVEFSNGFETNSESWLRMHNLEKCFFEPFDQSAVTGTYIRHRAVVCHSENPKVAAKLSHNAAKRVLLQNSLDMFQKRVPTRATGLVTQQPSRFHAFTEVLRIYELVSVTRLRLLQAANYSQMILPGLNICS